MPPEELQRPRLCKPVRMVLSARTGSAFTLLEVIGVLAILAILAVAILSATTKSIDAVFSQQESATLQSFATALQNSILRYRYIPGPTDWCQKVADELGVSSNSVYSSNRNPGSPRVFMADPKITLPYTQSVLGTNQPLDHYRVLLLSSLTHVIPPEATVPANFGVIWSNQDGSLPPIGLTGWNADDLKVQRINLAPLFVNLLLTNLYSNVQGFYAIDGQVYQTNLSAYFLRGTVLQLYDDNSSNPSLQVKMVLDRDGAKFYIDHAWRDVPYPPIPTNSALAQTITAAEIMFAASPNNLNGLPTTPASVISSLTNFMNSYTIYATNASTKASALAAQTALQNALIGLANNPMQGGCGP
jgi:type II secretory pathway pseudopilin PulG